MKKYLIIMILVICLCGCERGLKKDDICVYNDDYELIQIEENGIIYVKGINQITPYYSPNGYLCTYEDGNIKEVYNNGTIK